jgi:hypothetical protein
MRRGFGKAGPVNAQLGFHRRLGVDFSEDAETFGLQGFRHPCQSLREILLRQRAMESVARRCR